MEECFPATLFLDGQEIASGEVILRTPQDDSIFTLPEIAVVGYFGFASPQILAEKLGFAVSQGRDLSAR